MDTYTPLAIEAGSMHPSSLILGVTDLGSYRSSLTLGVTEAH